MPVGLFILHNALGVGCGLICSYHNIDLFWKLKPAPSRNGHADIFDGLFCVWTILPLSKLCHHRIRKTRICSWTRRLCWWPGQMCFNQDNRRGSDCFLLQTRPHWSQDVNVALAISSKSNQIHLIVIKWLIWPIGPIATCSCNFISFGNDGNVSSLWKWFHLIILIVAYWVWRHLQCQNIPAPPRSPLNEIIRNHNHMEHRAVLRRDLCPLSFSSHKFHQK